MTYISFMDLGVSPCSKLVVQNITINVSFLLFRSRSYQYIL
uniref:Uncharacterized protein n=1 Tax=Arundo donax TaxID=35708 RepID=A0A0A9GLS2_ARUDO